MNSDTCLGLSQLGIAGWTPNNTALHLSKPASPNKHKKSGSIKGMKNKFLLPLAASLGALATLIIPVISLFWAYSTWRGDMNPNGTPDDAPWRAATILLFLSPGFFVAIFLGMLLVSYILHARKLVSKKVVSLLVLIIGSIIPILFALDNYDFYEMNYFLKSFVGALIFFLVSLSLGVTVWWRVYHKGLKN